MYRIKQIRRLVRIDFIVWIKNPRVFSTLILAFLMCMMVTGPLMDFAHMYGVSVNISEPFLTIFSDYSAVFLMLIGSVLLFCDAPFAGIEQPFYIVRTGRRTWILSKVIFIFLTSAFYMAIILLVSSLLSFSNAYIANIWSDNTYAIWSHAEQAESMGVIKLSSETVQYMSPFSATLNAFLLGTLYSTCIGCIVMAFNLFTKKALGIFTALVIHTFGFAMIFLGSQGIIGATNYQYLSLMTHVNLASHSFTNIFSLGRPSFILSYSVFLIILAICATVSYYRVKSYSLYFSDHT